MERRFAAIFAADVVGYPRLIGADEARTLAALRGPLKELAERVLKRHRGRVVKLMGDRLLAEFASVVDAVAAAAKFQEATPERSARLPKDRRIALRIAAFALPCEYLRLNLPVADAATGFSAFMFAVDCGLRPNWASTSVTATRSSICFQEVAGQRS